MPSFEALTVFHYNGNSDAQNNSPLEIQAISISLKLVVALSLSFSSQIYFFVKSKRILQMIFEN